MTTTNDSKVYVFTEKGLREHDLNIAVNIGRATTLHVVRAMNKMKPSQQLQAMSDSKRLELPRETLEKIISEVCSEESV
ncbi:hypothetical protein [Sansalvadorimonas verongulae]|uniref:hypothetical protein n=1 Tax=Sansalvadorimonas verongulae TaxID=2172824 RepID=UPI0012BCA55A|nr:hypothetical protein [Sansalvadorimonas verongulae]MTI13308.1 hypothetical protein [Sansalvadorimonas verongulae]